MNIKNNKVYLLTFLIFIWNFFYYYLKNIINDYNIINYIFWVAILLVCIIIFNKGYQRNKYKDILFKDIIIFTLLYLIIYYLLGFIVGFQKSPLNFSIINIIKNLIKYAIIRTIIESVKYYLIKENNTKIYIILVTILFIIITSDINNVIDLIDTPKDLFKYISSTIVPNIMYGLTGTYIIKHSSLKANILLQIVPIILIYTIPISPNLDWYLYGVFHTIYLLLLYTSLKYEIEKREQTEKNAKRNIFSLIPITTIFVILILFVLGIFTYIPIGVMSNSMKPYFERGDIIIYKKIKNIDNIKINDVICYQLDNIKVMHRVVKIEEVKDKKYFTTKGDNLLTNDPLRVKEEQVIGTIVFTVPRLGYPSVWLYEMLN